MGKQYLPKMKLSRDMAKKRYFWPKKSIQWHETSWNARSNLWDTVINHHTKDDDDKKVRKYDYLISPIFQSAFLTSRAKTAVKNSPHKIEMEQVVKHL